MQKLNPNQKHKGLHYMTVWRWHFYAGLWCIPFILWLSCTGMIYLFKPQIDSLINKPYDNLVITQPKLASEQVEAAVSAVPHGIFSAYELAPTRTSATRVLVAQDDQIFRVYVHPETLQILKVINQNDEFTRQIFLLHGEFMQGDNGSHIMQIAASWTVVLVITGLWMWMAKGGKFKAAGMLYPRFNYHGRSLWKELHSVVGFWASVGIIFVVVSGLPWSASWGTMLKNIREWSTQTVVVQDWTTSTKAEGHQNHQNFQQMKKQQVAHHGGMIHAVQLDSHQNHVLNQIFQLTQHYDLAHPVLIKPQINQMNQPWSLESQAQDRTLREKLIFDSNGQLIQHKTFEDQAKLDRIIAYGVAIHEGRYFGWANIFIALVIVTGLIILCISALAMWLKRKPRNVLGTPPLVLSRGLSTGLKLFIIVLGILLPLLGISLLSILLLEKFVFSRIKCISNYLGLDNSLQ